MGIEPKPKVVVLSSEQALGLNCGDLRVAGV
jgi:hypothetical protein